MNAQRDAVIRFVSSQKGQLLHEFSEVERCHSNLILNKFPTPLFEVGIFSYLILTVLNYSE